MKLIAETNGRSESMEMKRDIVLRLSYGGGGSAVVVFELLSVPPGLAQVTTVGVTVTMLLCGPTFKDLVSQYVKGHWRKVAHKELLETLSQVEMRPQSSPSHVKLLRQNVEKLEEEESYQALERAGLKGRKSKKSKPPQ